MTFALNPRVAMSVGKAVAQVSHAVLNCARSAWAADPRYAPAFAAWRAAGYPGRIASPDAWATLRLDADGVVRDAGLTEVNAGTETVLATPPSMPPDRSISSAASLPPDDFVREGVRAAPVGRRESSGLGLA